MLVSVLFSTALYSPLHCVGYFAYIDLSPAHGSSVVTLSSPVNSAPTSASCAVTLFYFLNGLAARSLKITIAQADNTAIVSRTITSTVASSVWQTVTMPIPQTAGHFKVHGLDLQSHSGYSANLQLCRASSARINSCCFFRLLICPVSLASILC